MREKIKLESSAGTGHFYTTTKNKRTMPEKMEIKKVQEKKKTQSPERIQLHKMSTDKSPEKDSDVMKKIMAENRHKKFMERKK